MFDENCFYGNEDDPYLDFDGSPLEFADPGGTSALRAGNRIYPCPTCGAPNRLTAKDKRLGYQCDACADAAERGVDCCF
jgi:hypothetical protein